MALEPERSQSGTLIALEGDYDIISTQLRLLPPSHKILIIPSLQEYLSEGTGDPFDARSFVKHVYTAYTERAVEVRSFLQDSKLVFMNGGSVSARTTCIRELSQRLTNGDIAAAELMFNEIVKDGVVGLMTEEVKTEQDDKELLGIEGDNMDDFNAKEDPIVRAMKAAEILDQETAALQTDSGIERHLTTTQDYEAGQEYDNEIEDKKEMPISYCSPRTPAFRSSIFSNQGEIVETILTIPSVQHTTQKRRSASRTRYEQTSRPVDHDVESTEPSSPIVIGKARIVDFPSATKESFLRRTRSADEILSRKTQHDNHHLKYGSMLPPKHTDSINILQEKQDAINERGKSDCEDFSRAPPYPSIRASQGTLEKSPTSRFAKSLLSSPKRQLHPIYVDRGTDAEKNAATDPKTFLPVFDLVEDFVIQFTDKIIHDDIFEAVIQSYKNGSYPIVPDEPINSALITKDPMSPTSISNSRASLESKESTACVNVDVTDSKTAYETKGLDIGRRHDPIQLTPPATSKISEKFLTFNPVDASNAIDLQNAFRKFLKSQFPVEKWYNQYYREMTSEVLKPMFKAEEDSTIGIEESSVDQIIALGSEDGVSKDLSFQISGLVERLGIKKNGLNRSGKLDIRYLIGNVMESYAASTTHPAPNPLTNPSLLASLLVPQLESYLTFNSSTRLLILQYPAVYLPTVFALRELLGPNLIRIAGIVDSLASDRPSHSRSRTAVSPNPLSNDAVALRNTSRLNPQRHSEPTSGLSFFSSSSSINTPATMQSSSKPSFSKADFVLPSTATDTEIAAFISSIWKPLIEKNSFYLPDSDPEPKIVEKVIEAPAVSAIPKTAAVILNPQRPRTPRSKEQPPVSLSQRRENKLFKLAGKGSGHANGHVRDRSIPRSEKIYAESVMTTATERDRKWENFYIGEEDSDDDDWDRMILGRAGMKRLVPESILDQENFGVINGGGERSWEYGEKGIDMRANLSKRKALKWLGLA